MIYVLRTKNNDPAYIKVGYAKKDIAQRIATLQTGCPLELELIFAKNGAIKDEKALHRKLKAHHVTGEWFRWNEETSKILKVPLDATPINPTQPGFLTPRQKQINNLFRMTKRKWVSPMPLEDFMHWHPYSFIELTDVPPEKAAFVIVESSHDEVFKAYGHTKGSGLSRLDPLKRELWIIPKQTVNMHEIIKSRPVLSQ